MADTNRGAVYDEAYYRTGLGPIPYGRNPHWLSFFGAVAEALVRTLAPRRVLDAGCAMGLLVEALRDRGVEAWGIDVSEFSISQVREDVRPYCGLGLVTDPPAARFDLVTCIEVLEHLPASEARLAVRRLSETSDTILFSSSPVDFDEPTHINVQPPIYWLRLFGEFGFWPDLAFDAVFLSPHAFLARKGQAAPADEALELLSEKLRLDSALCRLRSQWPGRPDQSSASADTASGLPSRAVLQRSLEHAESELARARHDLQLIRSSPAWRLISIYRSWLQRLQDRHPAAWQRYESGARWALGRLGAPAAVQAPAPPAASRNSGPDEAYAEWIAAVAPSPDRLRFQEAFSRQFRRRPLLSVVVPVYRVPLEVLRATLASVRAQTYGNWELCIAHGDPTDGAARDFLQAEARKDARIRLALLDRNLGISGNSNAAARLAGGEYFALLDHDDLLTPDAFLEMVQAINERPEVDFWYSDKDQTDASGALRAAAFVKPGWSPELILSVNYLTHLTVIRAASVRDAGGWRPETDGAQDWDLFLRLIARGCVAARVPKILYRWRRLASSVAGGGMEAKPYAAEAQRKALREFLMGLAPGCDVTSGPDQWPRVKWPANSGPVSVILVHRAVGEEAMKLAAAVAERTDHPDFEIVVPLARPAASSSPRVRAVKVAARDSLQGRLWECSRHCLGKYLIFLDASVEVESGNWLRELTGPLGIAGVGIAGPKTMDADTGRLRHVGLLFNERWRLEYPYAGRPDGFCDEFGSANWMRNWLAVSGACFAVRRELWEGLRGFREFPRFPRLDVDFCLRAVLESGSRVVANPEARLLQRQPASLESWLDPLGPDSAAAYAAELLPEGDPYFSPNLSCRAGKISLRRPDAGAAAVRAHDYQEESRTLAALLDVAPGAVRRSATMAEARLPAAPQPAAELKSISWFLTGIANPFYGGIHTILRFADYFQRAHGAKARFVIESGLPAALCRRRMAAAFPDLAARSEILVTKGPFDLSGADGADAAVATFWRTAYSVLHLRETPRKFYFIQDDETLFYPAGTTSALAAATYGFGFFGLCNSITLLDQYRERGGRGMFFDPCVDPEVFRLGDRPPTEDQTSWTVFLYARPGHPRNCFELLSAAARMVKKELGNRVRLVSAGADWSPAAFGLDGIVDNLGVLAYRNTGTLYRACDAGVAFMTTAHPSYLPFELMACGALVVANRNPKTEWLLKDRENCLLAETSPSCLAAAVIEGLESAELRERITRAATDLITAKYSSWESQAEKVYRAMCGTLQER